MFNFEHYQPGKTYGEHRIVLDDSLLAQWADVYGEFDVTNGIVPLGFLSVITLRSYTRVITPRPPGNIHGAQAFEIFRALRAGDVITTSVSCENKEIRRERRWVYLGFDARDAAGERVFRGRFTSMVAE